VKDFFSNIKQLFIDDIVGSDTLKLGGASNIYRYNIEFPPKYPCLKIIPIAFTRLPEPVALANMFRLYPKAVIEYHTEEINAENGPEQASEMLFNLVSIVLKDTDVNGWGFSRTVSDLTVLLDDTDPGNPIRVAALIYEGSSGQTVF
jgi:hypothetical protein